VWSTISNAFVLGMIQISVHSSENFVVEIKVWVKHTEFEVD
jgi:hypothetical protein